ncbi:MAG: HAD family phosphatase [Clostridia bacterium]|nr:HAD family phosphatase [Clostridia bacterium]
MKLSGAIFDMDGTLLDSMGVWAKMGSTHLRTLGFEPRGDIDSFFTSFSFKQAAEHYKYEYGVPMTVEEIIKSISGAAEKKYRFEVQAKSGVPAFLQKLAERGVTMCVATNTERELCEAAFKRCGIHEYFKKIITCTELSTSKKEPLIYRECLKALGATRENTLVFEDALFAATTAKSDGFKLCGVFDEHERKEDELIKLSDVYLNDYTDFDGFIKAVERL